MKKMHINATTFLKLDQIKFSVEYERAHHVETVMSMKAQEVSD